MRCDYCHCILTLANDGGFAPHGLPLYVCKECYKKLEKLSKNDKETRRQCDEP